MRIVSFLVLFFLIDCHSPVTCIDHGSLISQSVMGVYKPPGITLTLHSMVESTTCIGNYIIFGHRGGHEKRVGLDRRSGYQIGAP